MDTDIASLKNWINKSETIYISGHQNPDGDCISACLAVAFIIKQMGKKVTVFLEEFSEKYSFLPGREMIHHYQTENIPDLYIAVDCGSMSRLGKFSVCFEKTPFTINIDHHITNEKFGDLNIVNPEKSSTCELIYEIFHKDAPFDKAIATCLYTGILYDTAGFLHPSTGWKTHLISGELLQYDIDFTSIYNQLMHDRNYSELRITGEAFSNTELIMDGKIAFTSISIEQMKKYGSNLKELDAIVNQLLHIHGVMVAVFIYELGENNVKVSLRSVNNIDVSQVATIFQGGGHQRAAGCNITGDIQYAKSKILDIIQTEIKKIPSIFIGSH